MKVAPILIVALTAVPIPPSRLHAEEPKAKQVLPPGMAEIITARVIHASYVSKIKATYKEQDKEYQTAESLYRKAYGPYEAWVGSVKFTIVEGKQKDLPRDPQYKKLTADAEAAGKAFIDHAENVTVKTKSILGSLFDAGVRFWNFCRKKKIEERKERAALFEELAKWEKWEDIKRGPTPAPASSATPPTR
jgi:hypothetical protein